MINKVINHSLFQFAISATLVAGALLCIFTPNILFCKWAANFANQIILGYLLLGLGFMLIKQPRIMFVSFACCASLCLFLQNTMNSPFKKIDKVTNAVGNISVAHFTTSKSTETIAEMIDLIKTHNADLVSIQEIDDLWAQELKDCMSDFYPSMVMLPDTGFQGLAILSRYPLEYIDTFHFEGNPSLHGIISTPNNKRLNLLSIHTAPAVDDESYQDLVSHLKVLSNRIQQFDAPYITLGEYNAVSWSNEITAFKKSAGLKDSRKGMSPTYPSGQVDLLEIPVDHIFYSNHLQCVEFKTLDGKETNHLGIMGTYEFKPTPKALNVSNKST